MRYKIFNYIILWIITVSAAKNYEAETKLQKQLLSPEDPNLTYNTMVPPKISDQPVELSIEVDLVNLVELDEITQSLRVSLYYSLKWQDERLAWDQNTNGIKLTRYMPNQIWVPDIILTNANNGAYPLSDEIEGQARVRVNSTGHCTWFPLVKYEAQCNMKLRAFPFDVQSCFLRVTGWTHESDDVKIIPAFNEVQSVDYIPNYSWDIVYAPIYVRSKIYEPNDQYDYLYIHFIMKRDFRKYSTNIIIPCVIFGFLCALTFYIPSDSGERLGLSLSILISIAVYQVLVADLIPKAVDETPVITVFLMILIVLIVISIFMTVISLKVFGMSTGSRVNRYLFGWIIYSLAPILLYDDKRFIRDIIVKREAYKLYEKYLLEQGKYKRPTKYKVVTEETLSNRPTYVSDLALWSIFKPAHF